MPPGLPGDFDDPEEPVLPDEPMPEPLAEFDAPPLVPDD